jgi:pimeloyl-ACP methyl ester carboxylesterase
MYFTSSKGLEIYYEVINEDEDKIPLVFIHGYGSSLSMFSEQIPLLRECFKLILFDAESHGKSDKADDSHQENLFNKTLKDIEDLLTHLGLNCKIGIIAHSLFGNGVAQKYAINHPETVLFLILLNGGSLILDSSIRTIFWNLLPQFTRMHFHEIAKTSLQILLEKTIPFIRGVITTDKEQDLDLLDDIIEDDINNMLDYVIDLSRIECPTLIIGAELDNFAPAYMSKQLKKNIKNSEMHIVSMTGHFGLSQRHHEYNKRILHFLKKNDFLQISEEKEGNLNEIL